MELAKNKEFCGAVTLSTRGQITIPAQARRDLDINPGEKLLVLGDLQ
jgi:AbrB family looped-hinge helix DNA binding protein